ncbi:MAG TPA: GTPase domain-containing protein [Gemmataceae bacterium]|nr:GTPase domain-containing protein [Gemmataceae bacterium]
MDPAGSRTLTSQLADDLGWLEQHCRRQPDQALQAGRLRLAASLVRNCIGPFLDGQPPTPLHVVVVGGAGAGKSTVANLLSGSAAAEANPQAGFTRHPVAYLSANGPLTWASHLGFLGPLNRLAQPSPASLDADVYQVRRVPADPAAADLLKDFVIWDCPDMTTWAAGNYVPRLLEVAGLADIIVYVASDERYNDEVPTQFLHLLLQTGKPVVACLVKMKEEDAPALVGHFQRDVLSRLPPGAVVVLPVPHLSREQLADPARRAARYRIPLLNQVAVLGSSPSAARRRTVRGAMNFLLGASEHLLSAAREDIAALQGWRNIVHSGQVEFDQRYRREYLNSAQFRSFDEALIRLIDLLELPGVGRLVSGTLWVLRTPYRLLRGLVSKAFARPESATLPEQQLLEDALNGWLDLLRKEAARRAGSHPLWAHIEQGFATGLGEMARERFQQGFRNFQLGLADEVERTARSIYEELEKRPALLNTLRGGKFAIDVAAIGGTLAIGHVGLHDLILVPLVTSVTHQLVELLGKQYVDMQRELTRQRQQALMAQYISTPLAEWLTQWPATGGSTYERLQLALRRIPPAVQQLDAEVTQALKEGA